MKSLLPIAALFFAFAVGQSVSQTPPASPQGATGVIEGIITRAGTPEPIPGVTVQLNIAQAAPARGAGVAPVQTVLDATTDEAGHFIFKDLYPGRYQMRYVVDGFFPVPDGVQASSALLPQQAVGARGGAATPIAFVLDTQQPFKFAIQLAPGGVISGRVSDANGRPIISGQVSALRIAYQDGQRLLTSVKTAMSNDRGEYRIFGLESGEYYVRCEYRRISNAATYTQDTFRAYFPGVEDPNSAAPTSVRSGTESSGTNIAIRPTTTVTISGTVVAPAALTPKPEDSIPLGAPRGTPLAGLSSATTFYVVPLDAGGLHDDTATFPNSVFGAADRSAGKFEIRNVRPGRYDIYTMIRPNPADAQERQIGHASVNVGNQDLTGVNIVVSPGVELKARFTSKDPAALQQAPTQLTLRLREALPAILAQSAAGRGGARGASSADWRVFPGLTEGRYVFDSPLQSLRDAYVADIRQGDRSIYESATIVIGSSTPDPVEFVLARPGGTIDGTVLNSSGKPAVSVSVMLIPNGDRRQNPMLYKRGNTNADGKVTLSALAPGSYKLFAWESIPNGAELNAEYMREYEERGFPVTIEAGAQLKVQLPLIPTGKP